MWRCMGVVDVDDVLRVDVDDVVGWTIMVKWKDYVVEVRSRYLKMIWDIDVETGEVEMLRQRCRRGRTAGRRRGCTRREC